MIVFVQMNKQKVIVILLSSMSINFESKSKIIKTGEEEYIYTRGPTRKALG